MAGGLTTKPKTTPIGSNLPWLSAMAQGEGASLLVRAHAATKDDRFADAAHRALGSLAVPIAEGGLRARLGAGFFLEEYPTDPPSHVLNGGIFALWGYHDVALGLGDEVARREFERGVDTLAQNVGRWDTGSWSRYDLFPRRVDNVASSAYHLLHINQLLAMQLIAPSPELAAAAARFEGYLALTPAPNPCLRTQGSVSRPGPSKPPACAPDALRASAGAEIDRLAL